MPTILAATDFSAVADNAINYACKLAGDINASVTIIHSFFIPVTFNDTPMPVMPIEEGRTIAEDRMKELIQSYRDRYPGVNIESKILYGEIVDSLQEYAAEINPDLVVLGNSGSGDTALWLGSSVLSALKNINYPVLAIPGNISYSTVSKLCLACDFKNVTEHFPFRQIASLVNMLKAELHVLNIDHNNKHFGTDTPFELSNLHSYLSDAKPQYHYVDDEDTDKAINDFVKQNRMDWLVITPHKHSFFEGLFHKSHTKALVKMSDVPLVALPEK